MKKVSSNKKILKIVSVVVAIFICLVSVGYAFFNDSLTINGVASTVDYYSGTMLPTNPIMLKPMITYIALMILQEASFH